MLWVCLQGTDGQKEKDNHNTLTLIHLANIHSARGPTNLVSQPSFGGYSLFNNPTVLLSTNYVPGTALGTKRGEQDKTPTVQLTTEWERETNE